MDIVDLQNDAIEAATEHIKGQRAANRMAKLKLYCLTVFACVAVICAAVVSCFAIHSQQMTIIEQQYALNMQYANLMEYVAGAEITTTTSTEANSGENGTAIAGDGNYVVGGDMNGDG